MTVRSRPCRGSAAVLCLVLLAACSTPAGEGPASSPDAPTACDPAPDEAAPPAAPVPVAVPVVPPRPALPDGVHLARYGAGDGPSFADGVHVVLDAARTPGQSNSVAFDRTVEGARESVTLRCRLRVLDGGDGGAFLLLGTAAHGVRGPAPFVANWTEPNLRGAFAVGIDVHDPKTEEPFGPDGNVLGAPERQVSIHWDGREIVKRVAASEFRGDWADVEIRVAHVVGGGEVSVRVGAEAVYDRYFVAGLDPFEMRPAFGAGTRADATTRFDVSDVRFEAGPPAAPRRPPLHVEVFHHVRTDNSKTAFEAEADLPPADWAFGRVLLTLEIHDGGQMWDEWDRNGEVSVVLPDGRKLGIVPFITSYRVPCRWQVDVTHFRPLLAGRTRFEVAAGTNFYKGRGYLMSVALDFHHGTPDLEPYRVVPLWHGVAHYRSDANHFRDFFDPQTVGIDAEARAARVFTTTTGHSQVGEFTPSDRAIVVRPDVAAAGAAPARFESTLWKTDCWLNPVRPQFGTWKYPRAGWAPGDVVHPWWIDLTPLLRPGRTMEIRYEPKPYAFDAGEPRPKDADVAQASHNVRSYLILWRSAAASRPAPTLRVLGTVDGGPAAKAGIRAGDYLLTYEGAPIDTLDQLRAAIAAAEAAKKERVTVVVVRGSERIDVQAPPGRLGVQLSTQ